MPVATSDSMDVLSVDTSLLVFKDDALSSGGSDHSHRNRRGRAIARSSSSGHDLTALDSEISRNISVLRLGPSFAKNLPHQNLDDRVVIALVGLPARGKSYISKAILRYLNFTGCPAQLFNAGAKRRQEGLIGKAAGFFDASNTDAKDVRERMAMDTLDELLSWLRDVTDLAGGCACGIFDATNTTVDRREKVRQRVAREGGGVKLLFLELVCDDEQQLDQNYALKLHNADYAGTDPEAALADFKERVRQYEMVYQHVIDSEDAECAPLVASPSTPHGSDAEPPLLYQRSRSSSDARRSRLPGCIKMINAGKKLVATNCEGYMCNRLLGLLHSIHLGPRSIWIVLVGETTNDTRGFMGGDSPLSEAGLVYARAVRDWLEQREADDDLLIDGESPPPAMVLCGTLRRYTEMGNVLCRAEKEHEEGAPAPSLGGREPPSDGGGERRDRRMMLQLHRLNELCAGQLDSLSYDEMKKHYPQEYAARRADKLNYRYPGAGGESYVDLIMRLESVILSEQARRARRAPRAGVLAPPRPAPLRRSPRPALPRRIVAQCSSRRGGTPSSSPTAPSAACSSPTTKACRSTICPTSR